MDATRARYFAFVPIVWGTSTNKFKVELEAAKDLDAARIEEIKITAREYVTSRGQTLAENDYTPIEIFRKKG